jgi:peptidoglycan hydrolase-like protein with peptidoglycan-binding domain
MMLATAGVMIALTAGVVCAQGDADVERAQKALKQAGHDPGPADGVLGVQTSAALRAYQKAHGLEPTGRLDAATAARLREPDAAAASPKTGGDTRPNAVDPAQASKTGGNVGEGASYSRSTEKGQSTK